MAKVLRATRLRARERIVNRLRAGRKAGLTAAGSVFGIPAVALGLAGFAGIPVFLGLAAASGVVGIGVAYLNGRGELLPPNLIDEARNVEAPYTCDFCTEATLAEACDLTRPHYHDEYVSAAQAETWRVKNPKAFVHLLNREGDLSASFGVMALTESFTDQFFKGNVTDLLLRDSDVLAFDASRRAPKLYISGVVVRDPVTQLGHKRTAAMLWVMVQYFERLYGVRKRRTLYAIAVSRVSEILMKNLGFTMACAARSRQDKLPLYCFELTATSWKDLKTHVRAFGGLSTTCHCKF